MSDAEFWTLIEDAAARSRGSQKRQVTSIRKRLLGSTRAAILDFNAFINSRLAESFTWELWGAAYLINGGCSDDGFHYFRGWLISLGRTTFEVAVRDPDRLADVVDPKRSAYEGMGLCGVAYDAWSELTGEEDLPIGGPGQPSEPTGRRWDFDSDEQMRRRLPRLSRLYLPE
ncbi:MAG: DUF4240 domain-containing protein [Gemmataceae bacterium]